MSRSALLAWAAPALLSAREELPIDPASLQLWREAVALIERHPDEIWPGYRLGEIPALLTRPKVGEVLLRHPQPPDGYVKYEGKSPLGDEPLFVRRRRTVFDVPQETSTVVGNATTLVVTDRAAQSPPDDAWCLGTMVHEGFHAYAGVRMKLAGADEIELADYPDLDPEGNAHLELEGRALHAALVAETADEAEEQALRFLAQRLRRRANIPPATVAWEEGNESNEGLATYAEWRAHELWAAEGVGAALGAALPALKSSTTFPTQIERIVGKLDGCARLEFGVNGSPLGAGAVRYRGYFFGAALGRLLDRVTSPASWKGEIAQGGSMTALLRAALGDPGDEELAANADAFEQESGFAALVAAKRTLVEPALAERARRVEALLEGAGTLLRFDLSAFAPGTRLVPQSYTPFGIVRVDADRCLFSLSATGFRIGNLQLATKSGDVDVLVDRARREILLRTPTPAGEILGALGRDPRHFADATLEFVAPATRTALTESGANTTLVITPLAK